MSKNLLIVESPAKAKTIEKFLGKGFTVKSCYGHIRDLKKSNEAIDTSKGYEPQYEVPKDKAAVVKELKKIAKTVDEVWLATDEDREGEAISWHLCEVLKLDPKEVKRIVFHEITKTAIQDAVENPRHLDLELVYAQQARRILDRLVGFELSPILWRKVKTQLSAGRVQSVAVRIIVERERAIEKFQAKSSFKLTAQFKVKDENGKEKNFKAELTKAFDSEKEAEAFLNKCKDAQYTINDIQVKPAKKSPSAPFTTSTLQQESSRKMGYSVLKTMLLAQRLYEAGKITYMRTDSVNLSDLALKDAASTITNLYGKEYAEQRVYKTKSNNAQEAHEAIRPTDMSAQNVDGENDEQRLYDLIWKRTIASQMSDAKLEKTVAKIGISTTDEELTARGEVIKFEGFLKVYLESTDDENEEEADGLLPPLSVGQDLALNEMQATERFSRPPSRYTEASLVKKLEELGIGRPSTYAPTISTVQKRGYIVKEAREGKERKYRVFSLKDNEVKKAEQTEITGAEKSKLFPTDIGKIVTDFLLQHFDKVMDYSFTANIEKEFDEIAVGKKEWSKMIDSFYKPFHETVEVTLETAERASGERELGVDPESGKPVIARMGRYGPMVQIGKQDDEEKPRYAKIRAPHSIETIDLKQALEFFKLPRKLGEYEGEEVTASEGRFGPYILHKKKFTSLKDPYDPFTVTLDEAIEVIEAKRKADREKIIQVFEEEGIEVLNGRWGPFIKTATRNVKIPKETDPKTLTLDEIKELIVNAPEPKKGRFRKK